MTEDKAYHPIHEGELVLCYVSGSAAYFTTQPLEKQWGDDWDDAPYEHNAGSPYEWRPKRWTKDGWVENDEPRWEITKVFYEGAWLETPDDTGGFNSRWSVQDINAGKTPWLIDRYGKTGVRIMAGTPLSRFKEVIRAMDGVIYVEEKV